MDEGGIIITQKLMAYLLGKINETSSHGTSTILKLLYRFDPKTDDDL